MPTYAVLITFDCDSAQHAIARADATRAALFEMWRVARDAGDTTHSAAESWWRHASQNVALLRFFSPQELAGNPDRTATQEVLEPDATPV